MGGRLQGLEAMYLARLAGIETVLLDRDSKAPARTLADSFFNAEISAAGDDMARGILKECDLIFSATENARTLSHLARLGSELQIPVAFHEEAYKVSSSKLESNRLFKDLKVPIPAGWPECGFPIIVKPSGASGSEGVVKVDSRTELEELMSRTGSDTVIQQFLEGPSYSLEAIGTGARSMTLQVTRLEFDRDYDCKRVWAGPGIGDSTEISFRSMSERIAAALELKGIMDIEVIEDAGRLQVLEIDARFPSQTPSAVFHSSGVNMIELLAQYWLSGELDFSPEECAPEHTVLYEHFQFSSGVLSIVGEHALRDAQELRLYHDLFGADTFISNCESSAGAWVATAIFVGGSELDVWRSHEKAIERMRDTFKIEEFQDQYPAI